MGKTSKRYDPVRIRNRSKISCRRRPISRLNCRVKVRAKVRGRGSTSIAVQSLYFEQ